MENDGYPEVTVGALIFDSKGRVLLLKTHKWRGKYACVGGHVEPGERAFDALKREAKEETGLEVAGFEFLGWQEAVYSEEFHEKKHFLFLDFACRAKEGEVVLNDEASEYLWVRPDEALILPLNPFTRLMVERAIEKVPDGP